ncbi:hypothetical protein CLI64_10395 [Nostoc sp. CENA543]|uniref:hypothetical protein n=1 Tax=Nostoc sp. CENA543 TaxID=1869241 RepID=UPI000CA0F22D|nr:hypothetical protein [Nostoc sp. CENA543]AUT00773.1 hypothetical protein CLI64_10395 [Nostoc sp. CENA543]
MQLSAGIKNFWNSVVFNLLSGLVLCLCVLAINGWKWRNLFDLPDFVGLVILVAVAISPLLWFLSHLKSQLLRPLVDHVQFNKVSPKDYPWLDVASLTEETAILESLGFVHLIDHDVPLALGFSRCFAHPQKYCFAEIGQIFQVTGSVITRHFSLFSVLERDWILAEINREINNLDGISYIWRHPQHIRRYHPHLKLPVLFQEHLKFREQICHDLNIYSCRDVSVAFLEKIEQDAAKFRRQTMRRRNLLLSMIETTLFEINPQSEWLGNYPKAAAKIKR